MKKFLLIPALTLMAWQNGFAGVRLSSFQLPGSGHFAQVLLGDEAIKPISLKLKDIRFAGQDQCGLSVSIAGDVAQISGTPNSDACSLLFRGRSPVNDVAIDLPVEIYRLDAAPAPSDWPALLATLPKLPAGQLNEVFISSEVSTHSDFNMDKYFTDKYHLHIPGNSDTLPELNDLRPDQTQLATWSPKPYRSCDFTEKVVAITPANDDQFIAIKLNPDALGTQTIEHCKLSALATWDGGSTQDDLINIYVVKSYL